MGAAIDSFIIFSSPSGDPQKNPGDPHLGRSHGIGSYCSTPPHTHTHFTLYLKRIYVAQFTEF